MNINCANIAVAGESNIGTGRSHNEDNFLIIDRPGDEAVLCAIADGIGGHGNGEIASRICIKELLRAAWTKPGREWDDKFLLDAVRSANRRIFERNFAERRRRPMGCTVIAAIFFLDHIIFAFAGDSRLYVYDPANEHHFRQLSTDHRPGIKEGRNHHGLKDEFSNFVCRSLGTQKYVDVECKISDRPAQARYLMCSDGLYSVTPEPLLLNALSSTMTVRQITGNLMREALLAGARDNVSLICAGAQEMEHL